MEGTTSSSSSNLGIPESFCIFFPLPIQLHQPPDSCCHAIPTSVTVTEAKCRGGPYKEGVGQDNAGKPVEVSEYGGSRRLLTTILTLGRLLQREHPRRIGRKLRGPL